MPKPISKQYLSANCTICKDSKYAYCYHLEIPKNLDVEKLLRENKPRFNYNPNLFYYFIALVFRGNYRKEENERKYFFTRLKSKYLGHFARNYKQYFQFLSKHGVIAIDNHFIEGEKCRGYAFSPYYQQAAKQITIHDRRIVEKLSNPIISTKKKSWKVPTADIPYLSKWFNPKLTIDMKAVKSDLKRMYRKDLSKTYNHKDYKAYVKHYPMSVREYAELVAIKRYNARLRPAIEIHKSIVRATIDSTSGRLHTPLTNLKSELRKHVRYNGEILVSLDLVNSQPFLSGTIFKSENFKSLGLATTIETYNSNFSTERTITFVKRLTSASNNTDVKLFLEWTENGQFYENFGAELARMQEADIYQRKLAKSATFTAFFSSNDLSGKMKAYKLFESIFPTVAGIFSFIKYGEATHNALACTLQRLESQLFLHEICGSIADKYPDAPMFTIHDSVVTTEANKDFVKTEILTVMSDKLGATPKIKEEYWLKQMPVAAP